MTAYHLFFQLEREHLIQNTDTVSPGERTSEQIDNRPTGIEIDPQMPVRYQNIHLSPSWHASSSGKRLRTDKSEFKRKHRKGHGKIGFQDLSKRVAARWKNLEETDKETKMYCVMIGKRELYSYKQTVKEYKESITAANRTIVSLSSKETSPEVKSITAQAPISSAANIHRNQIDSSKIKMVKTHGLMPADMGGDSISFGASAASNPSNESTINGELSHSIPKLNLIASSSSAPETKAILEKNEFSFYPIPPSLREQEDSFLKSCQKRTMFSSNVGNLASHTFDTHRIVNDDVIFDSTMTDLSPPASESKSIGSQPSDTSGGSYTPLNWMTSQAAYNFTKSDAAMLLSALFD